LSTAKRPLSISVLVALQVLVGVLALLSGITVIFARRVLPEAFPQIRPLSPVTFTVGILYVIFTVLAFIVAYGLWVGRKWAWVIAVILSVFGIITSVFTLFLRPRAGEVTALIIDLVIMFYLIQPRVQAHFGRKSTAAITSSGLNGGSKPAVST